MSVQEMLEKALIAREKAYAPYSKFKVGAVVKTVDNKFYSGCNVENNSYGLSICAEREAIFNAVSYGDSQLVELLVVADDKELVSPCGACRQVMLEFMIKTVHMANRQGQVKTYLLEELLPIAFVKEDLKNNE